MPESYASDAYRDWHMGWGWELDTVSTECPAVTNSINATHPIPDTADQWMKVFESAKNASELLWQVSINYMVPLHKHDAAYALSALESFYDQFWQSRFDLRQQLGSSWDHCSSLRMKSLVALMGSSDSRMETLANNQLIKELEAENYWASIAPNNHGLMLVDALIGTTLVSPAGDGMILRAEAELERILDYVFGEDGFCNENSPAYHYLYIRLLRDLTQKYGRYEQCRSLVDKAEAKLRIIEQSISKIVRRDGMIPPLGDSNPSASEFRSSDGTFFSDRVGLWIYKHGDLFMTFKCGFESLTHKHADDTSVTLNFRGEELITDAGSSSYDYSDGRVLGLRTQKGHSGIFFEKFDDMHPSKLYSKGYQCRSALISATTESVRGGYLISGHYAAHRHVTVVSGMRIAVEDYAASIHRAAYAVRFIIPQGIRVETDKRGFWLRGDKVRARITFSERVDVTMVSGEDGPPFKGWLSEKANEVVPAHCVEVRRKWFKRGRLSHTIDLMTL